MASFILATAPAHGHINPVLPISRMLVERGHEVVWITGRSFKKRVEDTGAVYCPMPAAFDPGETEIYEFFPELARLTGIAQIKWYIKHIFLDGAPALLETIRAVRKERQADVLIGDSVTLGVYLESELSGIPSVMISLLPLSLTSRDTAPFGLGLLPGKGVIAKTRNRFLNYLSDRVIMRDVNIHANAIRRQVGLPPLSSPVMSAVFEFPSLVMQLTTPTFEYPRSDQPGHLHFIGPVLLGQFPDFSPPGWWPDLSGDCPVILANQGTVAISSQDLIAPTIEAFRRENVLVVAVPVSERALETMPKNVRAEKFIPFAHLLPYVDVMVTNGGYGGTQLALAHGVPLVVAGATDDKMEVAARVEWSGAGINLRQQRPSPLSIKKAVREVLSDPTYRENAQRIQRDFAQYNAPKRAAELVESLARAG